MKRQLHSSSPLSNSQISDEFEPVVKRPRFFVSSPTPPPDGSNEIDTDDNGDEQEEIIIDEPISPSVTLNEDRLAIFFFTKNHYFFCQSSSEDHLNSDIDEDEIIEIEQQTLNLFSQQSDNGVIVVSDSESDDDDNSDDLGIDLDDDIPPSVLSMLDTSIFSPDNEDVEIVQEIIEDQQALMDEEEEEIDNDHESVEIVTSDDNNNNDELIDLTDDEPIPISCSPSPPERKLSTDVQQCPICLETLSDLQHTGIYLIITRCRHVMCTLCSRQLLATSSRCPLCRENVSSTTLMPYCILT